MASINPHLNEANQKIEQVISTTQDEATQIDKIARIRGWFGPKEDSTYYPHVHEYVQEKISLEDAIAKITTPIDEAIANGKRDDVDIIDLWYSIIHSSKRISYRDTEGHSKIVALVKAIKQHPDPPNDETYPFYSAMPAFGMASREAYNDSPGVGAGYFRPEINAWINLNYFFARLTYDDVSDNYLFAIWAMRSALEKPLEDDGPHDAHKPGTAAQKYDAYVPAAAVWVFGLGRKLFEKEQDLTPKNRNSGNPAKGGELWKGGAEFSKERWAFWKKRFADIGGVEQLSAEIRGVAREAVEAMDKAEGS